MFNYCMVAQWPNFKPTYLYMCVCVYLASLSSWNVMSGWRDIIAAKQMKMRSQQC